MPNNLHGKTVAILATDGFEQSELMKPKKALEEAGARTEVVSPSDIPAFNRQMIDLFSKGAGVSGRTARKAA